jgi:hypothetical protein
MCALQRRKGIPSRYNQSLKTYMPQVILNMRVREGFTVGWSGHAKGTVTSRYYGGGNEEAFEDLEAETMIGVHTAIERPGDGGSGGGSQQQGVADESMERGDGRGGSGQKGVERASSDALWVSLVMFVPLTEGGGSGAMLQYRIRLDRFGKLAKTTLRNTAPELKDEITLDRNGSTL